MIEIVCLGVERVRVDVYIREKKAFIDLLCYATLCDPMNRSPPGSSVHGDSPGKNIRVGCHALLQGICPTEGSNPGLPHCRWILYCLVHQGSPRIEEWVTYPFSRGSSRLRNWTGDSCIAGGFFTSWATREAHILTYLGIKKTGFSYVIQYHPHI